MTQLINHIKTTNPNGNISNMALSKVEKVGRGSLKNETISIKTDTIHNICKVSYNNPISVEIISHLLGGENMDCVCMEVEDSFQCYDYWRRDIVENLQKEKEEITFFEDRKSTTSDILITMVKERRTSNSRQHLRFKSAVRMTIMVQPRVGFSRYFDFRGM